MTQKEYFQKHTAEIVTFLTQSREHCMATITAIHPVHAEMIMQNVDSCISCNAHEFAVVATHNDNYPYVIVSTGLYFNRLDEAFRAFIGEVSE